MQIRIKCTKGRRKHLSTEALRDMAICAMHVFINVVLQDIVFRTMLVFMDLNYYC
jgi:hypothetical protein